MPAITFDEAQTVVKRLPRQDRARLFVWMAADLADQLPGIELDPRICGGSARVAGTRIPVWSLESWRRQGAAGHDVLTAHDAGKSNQRIEDDAVLAFAVETGRAALTLNRKDFMRQHRSAGAHQGIIVCAGNRDCASFAVRIGEAIRAAGLLENQRVRAVRGCPTP